MAAQNRYDDPAFFAEYARLERSVSGLAGAPEWPALRALLPPDLRGLRVLDLGCGYGWFCRWARESGAARVLGVDVSERMLARAAELTGDAGPAVTYVRADLETAAFEQEVFDLAYSSLALHYVADLGALLERVCDALVSGGHLVFSVEHPLYSAPVRQEWVRDADGRRAWPVSGYLDEGPRITDWLGPGVLKQHRTIATYVNLLRESGFALRRLEEWGPTPEQVAARPEWECERDRPPFLLAAARKER